MRKKKVKKSPTICPKCKNYMFVYKDDGSILCMVCMTVVKEADK